MGWEQQITGLLQEAQDIAVRFDVQQNLTDSQKQTARNNIDIKATATTITNDDCKLVLHY